MDGVFRIFAQAGPTRLLAALGVTGLVAALLFSIMFRMEGSGKTLLFSGLAPAEASSITARLDSMGVKYDLRGDGSAVYVDEKVALKTRMTLAGEGLPSRGSIGYEIFDKTDSLGANTFVQNINKLRALEGELARTIMSLDGVSDARVHLVMPERRLFENEQSQASASIVLRTRGGTLDGQGVRAVRNLVASAVPGLDVNRVTLVDEHGRLLAAGAEDPNNPLGGGVGDRQSAVEERLRKSISDIVESVAGPGAARVQVSADLDMNRVTQASETFDPDGQVVRSTQNVEEAGNSADSVGSNGGVSAANNVPGGAGSQTANNAGGTQSANKRTEETVNYEISKTTKTEVFESGAIKRLSVAVAVDDSAKTAGDKTTYTPRSAEEMQRIEALVKSAMGFDEKRGDVVQVVNIAFSRPPEMDKASKPSMLDLSKGDIFNIAQLAVMGIAALALIFFVLRPLVGGLLTGGAPAVAGGAAMLSGPAGAMEGLPAPAGARVGAAINALEHGGPTKIEETIGMAKVQGEISASSVKRVAEVIDGHPEESMSILRNWMHEAQ